MLSMKTDRVINYLLLQNQALVPELGINLVSTGRLESVGFKIVTEKGISSLYSGGELFGVEKRMISNPYLYEFENCISNNSWEFHFVKLLSTDVCHSVMIDK